MRLVTFASDRGSALGVLRGTSVVPVPDFDMLRLIEMGEAGLERARRAEGPGVPLEAVRLLAPIPEPRRNLFAIGMNYAAHAAESLRAKGQPVKMPERPVFFTKATLTVNAPYGDIPLDPAVTGQLDWECELGVVIGRAGKNLRAADALDSVFGYTVLNDVTARDLQTAHGQFFKGKSLDGACPMGPWIVTRDEVPDPHHLRVTCRVNGVTKQDSNTSDFIFTIPVALEWLSRGLTLLPGDVFATGTPEGVGFARTPPEFLRGGDVVECEVEGVGLIRNKVVEV